MKAYLPSTQRVFYLDPSTDILKLDANESLHPLSPHVQEALIDYVRSGSVHWYPEIESRQLLQALSDYTHLPKENIQIFNGSDHALEVLCRSFLSSRSEVVLLGPTYDHPRAFAESTGAKIRTLLGTSPDSLILMDISRHLSPKTRLCYLVNPNNPTGLLYSMGDMAEAIARHPHILFIIDEAYYEFSGVTAAPLVLEYPNVAVVRSFSKAFGLAGVRCGYLLASPSLQQEMAKIRGSKSVNGFAQVAARAALEDIASMHHNVSQIKETRKWLVEAMKSLGLTVIHGPTNFILVKVAQPQAVENFLMNFHIFVRNRSHMPLLEGYVRITLGPREKMQRFWETFERIPQRYLLGTGSVESSTRVES